MKRTFAIILALLLALGLASPTLAQGDYYFAVDQETVHVYWNADGTMSLDYTWVFRNQPGAHIIDYVDVGMPSFNFYTSTASADVNGTPVQVSESDYAGDGSGFAIVLGGQSIPAGQTGTVHVFIGQVTKVLYPDSEDETYASGVFMPTYFGSQYVTGSTDMTVTFHLPPGIGSEEPRWHEAPSGFPAEPQAGYDGEGRITYTWYNPTASISQQYKFGASFPKAYVPADAIGTAPSASDAITTAITGFIAFVGSSLPCLCFAAIFLGIPIFGVVQGQRRKLQYLPPRISIEGHGIKRGLTAVEAAILMEQPLDKVMTMILFGVVKKGAAEVIKREPLEIKTTSLLPDGLHEYEKQFLKAFRPETTAKSRRIDLQDMTVQLVRSVADKVKGFSRKESIEYYKNITQKAWAQVEAAGTPEVKSEKFEENMEWTMLDKDYDDRTRRTFQGPVFVPRWWGHYDPTFSGRTATPTSSKTLTSAGGSNRSLPGADFAASMVSGVQGFSNKVLGSLNTFTEKVTGTTNPPPKPTPGRSGGGRSGGGCACACACAGCACACAGGGR